MLKERWVVFAQLLEFHVSFANHKLLNPSHPCTRTVALPTKTLNNHQVTMGSGLVIRALEVLFATIVGQRAMERRDTSAFSGDCTVII